MNMINDFFNVFHLGVENVCCSSVNSSLTSIVTVDDLVIRMKLRVERSPQTVQILSLDLSEIH